MKKLLILLLFTTAASFAQDDINARFKTFEQELETYRDSPEVSSENTTIKPAPCGQYNLKYMVTGKGFDQRVTVPPARKLCFDLNRFDRSKNPQGTGDWEYEIKPIGNRYYVIRAQKKGGGGLEEFYYYERTKNK